MGLNLLDRIQAKIELFRLEQRYTRRRNRRSTFVSNATYVNGEYIYNSPNTTGSSYNTTRSQPPVDLPSPSAEPQQQPTPSVSAAQKRLNRWSSMPGFGSSAAPSPGPSSSDSDSEEQRHQQHQQHQDWRRKRMSYAGGAA